MKKLSKAQEQTLQRLKDKYMKEAYDTSYYEERLANIENDYSWYNIDEGKEFYQEHIDMKKKGFILVYSHNSRTLEILAEHGLIEYIKSDRRGTCPIDWVKLL